MKTKIKRVAGVLVAVASVFIGNEAKAHTESPPPPSVANEIRQIPLDEGLPVQFMYDLEDVGSQQVVAPIEGTGALFELWADGEGSDSGTKTLVDSKVIGLYMPKAAFVVDVLDPWRGSVHVDVNGGATVERPVYRTRADQPFTVRGSVTDLLTDPLAPRAAREVNFLHRAVNAESGGYFVDPVNEYTIDSLVFTGSDNYNGAGPNLTGFTDSTLRNGVETFEMLSYADETVTERWKIGSATVKIFPVGTGIFMQRNASGGQEPFASNQVFTDKVRDIFVHYTAVYPDSKVYVQVYKGSPSLGTVGSPIAVSVLDATGAVEPQDSKSIYSATGITIKDSYLQRYFTLGGNGVYTLEIVAADMPSTFSNGGSERLSYVSFTVNRSVNVRGQIGTK